MSVPAELRVLCHQLSSTPVTQLPQITPLLLRNVLRCRAPLSAPSGNAAKADASETSVLVHKLKTHVSTLLNGKSIEGKFVAIVLIKGLVDVGGWEVLRTAEPWVRGLLAIVTKPQDPVASKKLAIITLTAVYVQTHKYQSLTREITTPTLPAFVTSSLNLIISKSNKVTEAPASLVETIFSSFSTLMPRHPAIFRPFAGQIRKVTSAYIAPTFTDARFVPESLKEKARTLAVLVNQTAPKNTSGEEWGKSIRAVVKDIHTTTDAVFRSVIEDWESSVGYVSQPIDVNKSLSGGGATKEDYPAWAGIDAGLERLTGLVAYLESHFTAHTATQVTVPIGIIDDLLSRLMSVAPPISKGGASHGAMRLHPGISREEREGLWAGLPAIHVSVMSIYSTLISRFGTQFVSLAQGALEHIIWTFRTSKDDEAYRVVAYTTLALLLPLCGSSLAKATLDRFTPVLRAICTEIRPEETKVATATIKDIHGKATTNGVANADTFLKSTPILSSPARAASSDSEVVSAAKALLPMLYTHLSQSNLEAYLRAELDRTSILTHNKEAMIASVMNPFLGKNGKSLPSIMPHLCRAFPRDAAVESLMRPRMPVIRESRTVMSEGWEDKGEEEDEDFVMGEGEKVEEGDEDEVMGEEPTTTKTVKTELVKEEIVAKPDVWASTGEKKALPVPKKVTRTTTKTTAVAKLPAPVLEEDDSDDESVHLEAGLSESEDEDDE